MELPNGCIDVQGARVHNLKNVSVSLPRNKLSVITGLSGSGKSSLAFDTIYAEGQRRYIDTFSAYARGFLDNIGRPDVDKITGLSPVISITQKTTNANPRSTVGTITEVYDFLRLLFARASTAYSYITGEEMVRYTDEQILELVIEQYKGQKVYILAQVVNNRKGHYKELFESIRRKGFVYVRVDGEVREITQGMKVERYKNHTIEVIVDRLKIAQDTNEEVDRERLADSIAKAMKIGDGVMQIGVQKAEKTVEDIRFFSRHLMCPTTGISYNEPAPNNFSFNSPQGWCPCCKGLGKIKKKAKDQSVLDEIIQDDQWYNKIQDFYSQEEEESEEMVECPECHGERLNKESRSYRFAGKSIVELAAMDLQELRSFLSTCSDKLSPKNREIARLIVKEICTRLDFMLSVGLSYLSLSRPSDSLSGGESQRIRLATQIGSQLINVLYILDEPSIGLHQRDNERLIDSLKQLRDMGNTVVVVEHDEQMMLDADYIVDIGPGAGRLGGKVVFQGKPNELLQTDSLTARYLNNKIKRIESQNRVGNGKNITLYGCTGNNLKNVTVSFPLGCMVAVTGVSGSGKSTLINQTLFPILNQHFYRALQEPLPYEKIEGLENIDKVIAVDQSPIGRHSRSNPATYTGVYEDIRELFANLPEAQIRGWSARRFSYNLVGGRCEECDGKGYQAVQMRFLPDIQLPCPICGGKRYNRETLEVHFKGKSIADVLDMTVNQAVEFFENQPIILRKIKTIQQVGCGYIKLGQSATTLSGGEAQRIKLAKELCRPQTNKTLYILDEPTTGLHFDDIQILLRVLNNFVEMGNSVIIIEHNLDIIRACDYIIDIGPEGGKNGGQIVAAGTRKEVKKNKNSLISSYL